MRIKIDRGQIIEAYHVDITPGGLRDNNNPGKYKNMICRFTISFESNYCGCLEGEFDCLNATTMEECEAAADKFIDELFRNGYIDISTEEKRKKYGMRFY